MNKQIDKYYTKPDVAAKCIQAMLQTLPLRAHEYTFIEPSAGGGSFLFSNTSTAIDIEPEHPAVERGDFLSSTLKGCNIVVYGNPPYGKRNSLSKAFITHSLSQENVVAIAFLLPEVYNKHTLQKVFPDSWGLASTLQIEPDSFTFKGDAYKIPCVFQVWIKGWQGSLRAVERKVFSNEHFSIERDGDIFVMGASPTTVKIPKDVTTTNRGYWLKARIDVETLRRNFKEVAWKGNSSANGGVAWLTKTELINQYEQHFKIGEYNE